MRHAIFITGGGSGIGRATAKLFAAKGWFVGLADINACGAGVRRGSGPAVGDEAGTRLARLA